MEIARPFFNAVPYFKHPSVLVPAVGSWLLIPSASMLISDGRWSVSADKCNPFDVGQRLLCIPWELVYFWIYLQPLFIEIIPSCQVNSSSVFCGTWPGTISQSSGIKVSASMQHPWLDNKSGLILISFCNEADG